MLGEKVHHLHILALHTRSYQHSFFFFSPKGSNSTVPWTSRLDCACRKQNPRGTEISTVEPTLSAMNFVHKMVQSFLPLDELGFADRKFHAHSIKEIRTGQGHSTNPTRARLCKLGFAANIWAKQRWQMVRTALHVLLHLLSVALYHIIIVMQLLFFFTGGLCQSFVVLYSCKLPMVLFISFYPLQKHSEERGFFHLCVCSDL